MIKYNFKKLDKSGSIINHSKLFSSENGFSKQETRAIERLDEVDISGKYEECDLILIKLDGEYVVAWDSMTDWGEDMYILYEKASNSLVTLSDIVDLIKNKEFKKRFYLVCDDRGWSMLSHDEESTKSSTADAKKKLKFDVSAVDKIWRSSVYDKKKLTAEENKQFLDGCHQLLDMCADKYGNMLANELGSRIFAGLLNILNIKP